MEGAIALLVNVRFLASMEFPLPTAILPIILLAFLALLAL